MLGHYCQTSSAALRRILEIDDHHPTLVEVAAETMTFFALAYAAGRLPWPDPRTG
jgi:hypothetical protein